MNSSTHPDGSPVRSLRIVMVQMLMDHGLDLKQAAAVMANAEPKLVAYGVVPDFGLDERKANVADAYKWVSREAHRWLRLHYQDHPLLYMFDQPVDERHFRHASEFVRSTCA